MQPLSASRYAYLRSGVRGCALLPGFHGGIDSSWSKDGSACRALLTVRIGSNHARGEPGNST